MSSASSTKPKLYEFAESCWANVPKLAAEETGYKDGDIEWVGIVLAEGANFDPEYLKVNPNGTVPTLIVDGKTYSDSITATSQLIKMAPHPPSTSAHTSTSIIEEVHLDAHDPNAMLLSARDDEDRTAKINGIPKGFLEGRQKALDKYAPDAPEEFKEFLQKKQQGNKQFLEFYTGEPDGTTKKQHFEATQSMWKSAGVFIRGPVTQAIYKSGGPFIAGSKPSEADYHVITWFARTVTNAGLEPGSPSSKVIPKIKELTGGHEIDPVIGKYWDAWVARDSFKKLNLH